MRNTAHQMNLGAVQTDKQTRASHLNTAQDKQNEQRDESHAVTFSCWTAN